MTLPDRLFSRAQSHRRPHLLALLLVVLAIMAVACAKSSAEPQLIPAESADVIDGVDASSAPLDPEPTATPPLSATQQPGSGLVDLASNQAIDWEAVGVSIDGVLRAVAEPGIADAGAVVASVWVPPGRHTVCIAEVPTAEPVTYWPTQGPEATPTDAVFGDGICGEADGAIDTPTRLLPDNRIIAHYGTGKTDTLGVLGEGTPTEATERLEKAAADYDEFALPVIPAFEFIATVATRLPEPSGHYTKPRPHHEIVPYFEQVRSVDGILVLDLQPGRGSFLEQAKSLETFLVQPDVHLALDPEWAMTQQQVPGQVAGSTDAATVNEVLDYLDQLVVRHGLPEKLLVVHQFQAAMVEDRYEIQDPPSVAVLFHIEAHGSPGAKLDTYSRLNVEAPFFNGFKVYFDEDSQVMTPAEVMAVDPQPLFVSYQ